jgi:hypothetical protein
LGKAQLLWAGGFTGRQQPLPKVSLVQGNGLALRNASSSEGWLCCSAADCSDAVLSTAALSSSTAAGH